MRYLSMFLAAALVLAATTRPTPADIGSESAGQSAYPDADNLLAAVVAGLPSTPIKVDAQLQAKKRGGKIERVLNAEMQLDYHGNNPSARYTIRDAFGRSIEGLNISWQSGGEREYRYFKGDTLVATPMPDLFTPIQDADISWLDLSLSFLWWPGGRTVGMERIKGRNCYIIDLPTPSHEQGGYSGLRLWIDPEINLLLQAVAYDQNNQPAKMLEVKSFKKINDVWVIQNIDVQTLATRTKTSLRVRDAENLAR